MTAGEVGDRYTELGGQLADDHQKQTGKRRIAEMRLCGNCHHMARYHHDGHCHYPIAPRGEDCGPCPERKDNQ